MKLRIETSIGIGIDASKTERDLDTDSGIRKLEEPS
jgi:hypothetical protein